ncbi:unnamed protein product [Fusarium graminearum]|nr:unnamed protein product [Fusarium graminearum]
MAPTVHLPWFLFGGIMLILCTVISRMFITKTQVPLVAKKQRHNPFQCIRSLVCLYQLFDISSWPTGTSSTSSLLLFYSQ